MSQCDDIKTHPAVFKYARKQLLFTPRAILFASAEQLQIPCYYYPIEDYSSADTDAFSFDWNAEPAPSIVMDSHDSQRGSSVTSASANQVGPIVSMLISL